MVRAIFQSHVFWAVLVGLILCATTFVKVRNLDSPDFKVFYTAAQHSIHDAENIYKLSPDRYLYPPAASLFFIPFAFSSHWEFHRWFWHGFSTFLLIFLGIRARKEGVVALLLLLRYFTINFFYGQINPLLLVLLMLAAWNFSAREKLSTIFWSLAGNLKIFPAVFSLSALSEWQQGDRARFGKMFFTSLVFTLIFCLLPFFLWGMGVAASLYGEFFQAIRAKGLPLHSHNQSFVAFFLRLFTKEPYELHGMGYTVWGFLNLPARLAKFFGIALGVVLSFFAWKKAYQLRLGIAYAAATSFTILFVSHLVWKDYFVYLFPALLPIVRQALEKNPSRERKIQRVILTVYFFLVVGTSPDIWTVPRAALFDAASIHLWGAVLVFLAWYRLGKSAHEQQ